VAIQSAGVTLVGGDLWTPTGTSCAAPRSGKEEKTMSLILLIVVVALLFGGGGGGYWHSRRG